jgi:hypothetical protein
MAKMLCRWRIECPGNRTVWIVTPWGFLRLRLGFDCFSLSARS